MPANDITDFLLKEYESLSEAFFEARETTAKWVKYYLIIMAAPFSFIAFMYKDHPADFDFLVLPTTLSILMLLIGIIGMFLAFIIIESSNDNILYARAVNGIRKIFLDTVDDQAEEIKKYIVLPCSTGTPSFFGWKKTLWISIITGIIDASYITLGLSTSSFLYACFDTYAWVFLCSSWIVSLSVHLGFYMRDASSKERKYGKGRQDANAEVVET